MVTNGNLHVSDTDIAPIFPDLQRKNAQLYLEIEHGHFCHKPLYLLVHPEIVSELLHHSSVQL